LPAPKPFAVLLAGQPPLARELLGWVLPLRKLLDWPLLAAGPPPPGLPMLPALWLLGAMPPPDGALMLRDGPAAGAPPPRMGRACAVASVSARPADAPCWPTPPGPTRSIGAAAQIRAAAAVVTTSLVADI